MTSITTLQLIIKRYRKVEYNSDVMRQSAFRILNPITVYSYGFPFNCSTVAEFTKASQTLQDWWTGKICLTNHGFTRPTPYENSKKKKKKYKFLSLNVM